MSQLLIGNREIVYLSHLRYLCCRNNSNIEVFLYFILSDCCIPPLLLPNLISHSLLITLLICTLHQLFCYFHVCLDLHDTEVFLFPSHSSIASALHSLQSLPLHFFNFLVPRIVAKNLRSLPLPLLLIKLWQVWQPLMWHLEVCALTNMEQ
ncbi:hypothetical protein RIF29_21759 [Crotalaria pallida]|uniref:Uncharacterized protein n=1 Tax=Crotalaria pallida TaxID=3830 RepID=A0AAN9F5B4_CROPI